MLAFPASAGCCVPQRTPVILQGPLRSTRPALGLVATRVAGIARFRSRPSRSTRAPVYAAEAPYGGFARAATPLPRREVYSTLASVSIFSLQYILRVKHPYLLGMRV